jgi:hypothetical protein
MLCMQRTRDPTDEASCHLCRVSEAMAPLLCFAPQNRPQVRQFHARHLAQTVCCGTPRLRSPSSNVRLILDRVDFTCKKCREKTTSNTTTTSTTSTPYASPYAAPILKPNPSILTSNEAKDTSKMTASYICEAEGCKTPIFHNPSDTRPLCKLHQIKEMYQISKQALPKPIAVSKPFRKDRLYPVKPDDKAHMNPSLKRKRSTTKRNMASEDSTFALDPRRPILSPPRGITRKVTSATTSPLKPTPMRTSQQRGKLLNSVAEIGKPNGPELDPNVSQVSPSMTESQISPEMPISDSR